ncbi:MAG TPA: acetyltransferase [Niallia sp.]|nr:acetyltransferase [Niallia sp.]
MGGLLILGAGGHGKVVAEIAMLSLKWDSIAFLDDQENLLEVLGIPIKGRLADYTLFTQEYKFAFVAIGNNKLRLQLINKLSKAGYIVPTLIHPNSTISNHVSIGEGTVIMAGSVINAETTIGKGCIINTSCSIDHDCVIEDGVHISPGSNLAGTVRIGQLSWVCLGACVSNNVTVGQNVIIAAGSAVIKDVSENLMVGGIPSSILKKIKGE